MSNDRASESEIADSIYRHVTEMAPWCSGQVTQVSDSPLAVVGSNPITALPVIFCGR